MDNQQAKAEPFLKVRGLTKMFGNFTALKHLDLDVSESEFVCFLGPSGCGKTTFLRAIAGLDIQTKGSIIQAGKDISALPPAERDFGIVFQSYALFPNLTVRRNVAYGLENEGKDKRAVNARVDELLKLVGLPDQADKYPAQLSGGQQQRIALARALATSPGLLLLDEPLSALDAKVRGYLRHQIKDLQEQLGVTTIMVTHDQEEALTMADRIVVMDNGIIEQVGTPTEIYREPRTLFVADFIGEMTQVEAVATSSSSAQLGNIQLATTQFDGDKGDAGVLTIRPEDILVYTSKKKSGDNIFAAKIDELEFLGSFWRAMISSDKLGSSRLKADISINVARDISLTDGMELVVELPQRSLRFYPGEKLL